MKKILFFSVIFYYTAIMQGSLFAQYTYQINDSSIVSKIINRQDAIKAANYQLAKFEGTQVYSVSNCREIKADETLLAYVYDLSPDGYVVVTASTILPPIVAYSFESNFDGLYQNNPLFAMLKVDLLHRIRFEMTTGGSLARKNELAWNRILKNDLKLQPDSILEQWPSVGNGWLTTNWTQSSPYNDFCPMDPVTSQKSYAGCPAVAMAQIINFHKTTSNVHFDDNDDYYHNYAGRQYWIDNDYASIGFPSFPQLDTYLDTLNAHYSNNIPPNNQDVAAITFACGVACTQVYTSQGSGTYSVHQAYNAYVRFGYTTVSLLDSNDTDLYERLKQNIKDTLPAHLAVVDSSWSTGHNVVVDGYNTDEYYHLNFGWGGSYDGWYLLPQEIPYNLNVIEGVVVDIKNNTTFSVNHEVANSKISVFPNPSATYTTIQFTNPNNKKYTLTIYNATGQLKQTIENITGTEVKVDNKNRNSGLYFFTLQDKNRMVGQGKFIIE